MLWPLGVAALVSWLVLVALAAIDVSSRPFSELREQARGSWLLASVATTGLSITAADLGILHVWAGWLVLSMVAWLLGLIIHFAIVGLIAVRAVTQLTPEDVTPDSWILMGSVAISTLAAAHVHTTMRDQDVFAGLAAAMGPAVVATWILATAWIPVLLAAEVWHFGRTHHGVGTARSWWSAVFPVGMYAAATQATAMQVDLSILHWVALVFFWIALGMFVMVAIGSLRALTRPTRPAA